MKPENRKDEIVRVAAFLFKEKGYSAVTMRDIAQELGIKAASLYNHIKSKQEILTKIIIAIAEEFTNGMNAIVASGAKTSEKLEAIIALHVKIATDNPYGLAALNADWMHLEGELNYYLRLRDEYEENFRAIITKGVENKEVANVDVEVMLFSILSTLRSLYLWIPKKGDIKNPKLASDLSKILLKGVAK